MVFSCALPSSYFVFVIVLVTIAPNGTIQLATPGSEGIQGIQAVTMANSSGAQQGHTILQYAQTPDGQQILVPSNQVVVQGEHLPNLTTVMFLFFKWMHLAATQSVRPNLYGFTKCPS